MTNDIPPPLQPTPRGYDDDEIMIPWKVADAARLQLEFLARSEALGQAHREAVRAWLTNYNRYVAAWIGNTYGPDAIQAADAISRSTAERMNANLVEAQRKAEKDLFEKLEEELKDE